MKFFKHALVTNSIIFLLASIFNAAIPFLLLPILTRVLLPEDYGVVSVFAVLLAWFGAFAGLSVHGGLSVKFFRVKKEELAQYIGACFAILLISSMIVLLIIGLLMDQIVGYFQISAGWVFAALLFSSLQFVINVRMSVWQSAGNSIPYALFQIGQSIINIGLSLFFVLLMHFSWQGRLLGQVISIGMVSALSIVSLKSSGYLSWPRNFVENAKEALRFGLPLVPHALGAIVLVTIDRIIIVKKLGLASAGLYMAALQVSQVVLIVVDSLNKAFSPWLMKKLNGEIKDDMLIVRGTYIVFAAILAFSVLYSFSAPVLLSVMVGDKFQGTESVVLFASLAYFATGCYYAVTNYIFYTSRTEVLAMVTAITALAHLALVSFLVDKNGIIGAAQALLISNLFSFFGTWYAANKLHPMPWFKLFKDI